MLSLWGERCEYRCYITQFPQAIPDTPVSYVAAFTRARC
jgi:hypothetical protein